MDWLRRLFTSTDKTASRVEAAGERIAEAAEQMAEDWSRAAGETRRYLIGDRKRPELPAKSK